MLGSVAVTRPVAEVVTVGLSAGSPVTVDGWAAVAAATVATAEAGVTTGAADASGGATPTRATTAVRARATAATARTLRFVVGCMMLLLVRGRML